MISALLVLAVAAVIGFGVALAVRSKREFATQNEVVPGRRSPAPDSWAGAHTREAKLHRRLGDAVRGAHDNPRFVELGLAEQMRAIDAEAMAIDERLVAAAALPAGHRDAALDPLEADVVALESTIAEMVTSITVADSKELLEQAVTDADLKLRALAAARAEIEAIDRQAAGDTDIVDRIARPTAPTQPVPPTASPADPTSVSPTERRPSDPGEASSGAGS